MSSRSGLPLPSQLRAVALLAVLSLTTTTGCSWLFVPKPVEPDYEAAELEEPDCVRSISYPAIDGLTSLGAAILGLVFVVSDASNKDSSNIGTTAGVPLLVASIPYGLSSWTGFSRVSKCKRYHRVFARRERIRDDWEKRREAAAGDEGGMCLSSGDDWTCHPGLACENYHCVKAKPGSVPKKKPPTPAAPSPSPTTPPAAPAPSPSASPSGGRPVF